MTSETVRNLRLSEPVDHAPVVHSHIRTIGVDLDANMRASIHRQVQRRLGKFAASIERVSIRLKDANGPRGGADQACTLRVLLKGLPSVVSEEHNASIEIAVSAALASAERAVRRSVERRRGKPIKDYSRIRRVA